jgi:hypothetical protein
MPGREHFHAAARLQALVFGKASRGRKDGEVGETAQAK